MHLSLIVRFSVAFSKYEHGSNGERNSISVIIAARNEASNLRRLIPNLLAQDYPDYEIIVALDRCTDDSKAYLDSLNEQKLSMVEISTTENGWNSKKYALNRAIQQAKGEWLVFTDADCIPATDQWLTEVNKQTNKDIVIGVSPYLSKGTFLTSFIQFEAFMTAFTYVARALLAKPYMAVGRNMAIRRSFFLSSKGYDSFKSTFGGDDDLFIQKNATGANTTVVLGKESIVFTYPKESWKSYFQQKTRHLGIGRDYKPVDQLLLFIKHGLHLAFLVLIFFNTTHAFFFPMLLFYLFIKLVSYRFAASKMGININYILLPLVDILYAVLIPTIALWSKLEKDNTWKN